MGQALVRRLGLGRQAAPLAQALPAGVLPAGALLAVPAQKRAVPLRPTAELAGQAQQRALG